MIPYRLYVALHYYRAPLVNALSWLFWSREYTNFTYDLEDDNKEYLASFVSAVTGVSFQQARSYIAELEGDEALKAHVKKLTSASDQRFTSDGQVRFGERLGWYALLRAKKPKVVVETGAFNGLGSCVMSSALMRNEKEGSKGFLYSMDINPSAGFLFKEPYSRYGKIIYGSSLDTLRNFSEKIDFFIHDSDHRPEYELQEYEAVRDSLAPDAMVLSDNSHATKKLLEFAQSTGRRFLYFQSKPKDHWYPGGGIGVAFKK